MSTAPALDAREHWDRTSRFYDRQLRLERAAVSIAVAMLAAEPGERCLDLGTGTGELLRRLARRHNPPARVTGIDLSPGMLAHVGVLPAGWRLALGDVRALPFPDATFDAASASYLLHLLPTGDLPRALGEIRRVLRPGGRLITITPAVPPTPVGRALALTLDRAATAWPERLGGLRALDPRPAITQAGFSVDVWSWSLRGYPSLIALSRA